jgi:phosphoribosylglycinamide formyltransferase 1
MDEDARDPAEQLPLFSAPSYPEPPVVVPAPELPLRLGVLVSGRGNNLRVLLEACAAGTLPATVVAVVANHSAAPALDIAAEYGIAATAIPRAGCPSRLAQQRQMAAFLDATDAHLIVCAGFDRVLEAEICEHYLGRIISLHPSLLPAFGGSLHAVADALAYGVKVTGVTAHFVTTDIDAGPIILQEAVLVLPDDTLATLTARMQVVEERLLPAAVELYALGRLQVEGRRVLIRP